MLKNAETPKVARPDCEADTRTGREADTRTAREPALVPPETPTCPETACPPVLAEGVLALAVRPELSLAEMVTVHYEVLYRYAYRMTGSSHDAEDLTQQTFLVAREKAGALRDAGALRGWLCRVLRNLALRNLRRPPFAIGGSSVALDEIPEETNESPIDSQRLQVALDNLPEEYRLTLLMFYFEDLSYREIAEELGIPLGTVMSRLARAKKRLRRQFESLDEVVSNSRETFGAGNWRSASAGLVSPRGGAGSPRSETGSPRSETEDWLRRQPTPRKA